MDNQKLPEDLIEVCITTWFANIDNNSYDFRHKRLQELSNLELNLRNGKHKKSNGNSHRQSMSLKSTERIRRWNQQKRKYLNFI